MMQVACGTEHCLALGEGGEVSRDSMSDIVHSIIYMIYYILYTIDYILYNYYMIYIVY